MQRIAAVIALAFVVSPERRSKLSRCPINPTCLAVSAQSAAVGCNDWEHPNRFPAAVR